MKKRKALNVLVLYFIIILFSACGGSTTEVKTGSLELSIQGLSTIDASVTVTGLNSFKQSVKTSTTLENLSAGDYTVTASDVIQGDTYFPDKRRQNVIIKGGETTSLVLTYTKQATGAGSLEVTIKDLPVSTNADVAITGPESFSRNLTTSSVLSNLKPGDYSLTANTVIVGSDTYTSTPTNQTVGVAAGSKTDLTVTYTKQSTTVGQLAVTVKGLPTNMNADMTVTGPNGFSETLTVSKTFSDLPPGEYTVTATKVDGTYPYNPSPKTQKLNVIAGERANALLAYVPTIPQPPIPVEGGFGEAVAVDGNLMVIGAPFEPSDTLPGVGFAYVYQRTEAGEWHFLKQLGAPVINNNGTVSNANENFGTSVAIRGDTIFVGSPGAYNLPPTVACPVEECRHGAVYVFERDGGGPNNFGLVTTLGASDPFDRTDAFGFSVAISGATLVVGAAGKAVDLNKDGTTDGCFVTSTECQVGEAYIFQEDQGGSKTWREVKKLFANDAAKEDIFGIAVSISGDTVVIGAYGKAYDTNGDGTVDCDPNVNGPDCSVGAAYLFQKDQGGVDNWGEVKKLLARDGLSDDFFGGSVAISDDLVAVGFYARNEAPAYLFQRDQGGTNNWGEIKRFEGVPDNNATYVALRGDTVLVGMPFTNGDVNEDGKVDCSPTSEGDECDVGSVSVFRQNEGGANNFGFVKRFVAADGAIGDALGYALALDDKTIIVSARGHAERTGAIYVLE
jgi:FG-GAP repeat